MKSRDTLKAELALLEDAMDVKEACQAIGDFIEKQGQDPLLVITLLYKHSSFTHYFLTHM